MTNASSGLGPVAAGLLLVLSACATTSTVPTHQADLWFPSPLDGPGRPSLERSQQRHLNQAWSLLAQGQSVAARGQISRVHTPAAGRLLLLQADLLDDVPDTIPQIEALAEELPDYAAAWITLSLAAERAGDEPLAVAAGRRGGNLWDVSPWNERPTLLHDRWVVQRVEEASRLVEASEAEAAIELIDRAMALEPGFRDGFVVRARALMALDRPDEAEVVLASLAGDADAIFLAGRIAEKRLDWQTAMDLYDTLPDDFPDKEVALGRTRLRWRLSHLPPHVHDALASTDLSRSELAVLLIALTPQAEAIGGGEVPVLSDIVDLPSHREILAAVRLDLLEIDPLEHRFYPGREVRQEEVRSAVEGLCHLLGLTAPLWCDPDNVLISSCTAFSSPVTGEEGAEMVVKLVQGEGS